MVVLDSWTHIAGVESDMLLAERLVQFGPKVQHNCCCVEHIPGLLCEVGSLKGIVAHQKDIVAHL